MRFAAPLVIGCSLFAKYVHTGLKGQLNVRTFLLEILFKFTAAFVSFTVTNGDVERCLYGFLVFQVVVCFPVCQVLVWFLVCDLRLVGQAVGVSGGCMVFGVSGGCMVFGVRFRSWWHVVIGCRLFVRPLPTQRCTVLMCPVWHRKEKRFIQH